MKLVRVFKTVFRMPDRQFILELEIDDFHPKNGDDMVEAILRYFWQHLVPAVPAFARPLVRDAIRKAYFVPLQRL